MAVIVAFTFVFTDFVVIEKEADVFPESTLTTGGTCADAGALLVMYTCTPSFGAFAFRVTVPVAFPPPLTEAEPILSDDTLTGKRSWPV